MTGMEAPERKREATRRQVRASDPSGAAWVSAHAGSGKTHVLVNRVIRLLLLGTDPSRILCLTYTRAAAAEMKDRLFDRLSRWIDKDDDALREAIRTEVGHDIRFPDEPLDHARRLFARALETPGGLKVQTIHAFCEKLLQAFPVEAGLAPGFEVLDDAMAAELLARARADVISRAGADERMREVLRILAGHAREESFDRLLSELLAHRRILQRLRHDAKLREGWRTVLAERIGADAAADPENMLATWMEKLDRKFLRHVAGLVERHGTDSERRNKVPALHAVAGGGNRPPAEVFEILKGLVLTQKGELRKSLLTSKVKTAEPETAEAYAALAEKVLQLDGDLRAAELLKANLALLDIGMAVMERYEALKRSGGFCDYDDLIARTLDLLSDDNVSSAWVLYRLDGGIDHVLVDEAQDTSPEQWEIIRLLTEEFCSGEGTRDSAFPRTIFAVGDFKQSIYSFQGAEPAAFRIMRERFEACYEAAEIRFVREEMNISFRTAPVILKAVDAVLKKVDLGLREEVEPHLAVWHRAPGLVEMWLPEFRSDDGVKRDPWRAPQRLEAPDHPRMRLARRIARTIRDLVARRVPVRDRDGAFRPVRHGDFLILLRRRTDLMDAIITALKQEGVPVAGADRLKVTDHLAVQDLMALGRFLLNREDDLSLACVLKSPLLERDDGSPFDDDDLMRLCLSGNRRGSLWARLRRAVREGAPFTRAVERLEAWWRQAGFLPPYEFYAHLLGRDGGRRAFLARMGAEALEPLDVFLDMARSHEMDHPASLTGFLDFLETTEPELKREMEAGADEVRVMTVHGAKGLEAPIVFLPDTCTVPGDPKGGVIRMAVRPDDPEGPEMPLWTMRSDFRPGAAAERIDEWKQKQLREYYRLLYVAMTRARDRLYVGGLLPGGRDKDGDPPQPDPASWYAAIREALFPGGEEDPCALRDEDGVLIGWRLEEGEAPDPGHPAADGRDVEPLPDWARRRPAPEDGPAVWLAPSRIMAEAKEGAEDARRMRQVISPLETPGQAEQRRFARGILVHRLLQHLPDMPSEERRRAAMEWLRRPPHALPEDDARALTEEVLGIMEDPRFALLFGPDSHAEAPFAARIATDDGREILVSGQIDRLVVTDDEVIVADYKTARPAPERLQDVPSEYLGQLGVYVRAMESLWPGRPVRAVLVWTATPSLMEIPREMLTVAAAPPRP